MAEDETAARRPDAWAGKFPEHSSGAPPGVILALVCAAQFMVVLDVSVVNVALPSIQNALGFTAAGLQWVATAYALVFGGFLLLGGRLADLYGHRRTFLSGLILFTGASLVGGLATTEGALIAARASQGLGAAVLAPVTLTVLTATFPEGPARTRALAIWTAVSLTGGAAGNLIGGALTQYLTWRSILLINVPIGAAALLAAMRWLTASAPDGRTRRLDVPGAVLGTLGLMALTYAISSPAAGRPVTGVALAAGMAALAGFVLVEARLARSPLLPPRLFRLRAIWLGNVVMLLAGAAFQVPMWYFLTLYMQHVLHFGALATGLGFLPHTVLTLLIGLRVTPWLMRRVSTRTLIVTGVMTAAAGFAWQGQITAEDTYLSGVLGPAVLISVGGGLFNTPLTSTVISGVASADAGAASGLMNTAKQIGGALGLATLIAATTPAASATDQALAQTYGHAFMLTALSLAAVAILALCLPPHRDNNPIPPPRPTMPDARSKVQE